MLSAHSGKLYMAYYYNVHAQMVKFVMASTKDNKSSIQNTQSRNSEKSSYDQKYFKFKI